MKKCRIARKSDIELELEKNVQRWTKTGNCESNNSVIKHCITVSLTRKYVIKVSRWLVLPSRRIIYRHCERIFFSSSSKFIFFSVKTVALNLFPFFFSLGFEIHFECLMLKMLESASKTQEGGKKCAEKNPIFSSWKFIFKGIRWYCVICDDNDEDITS